MFRGPYMIQSVEHTIDSGQFRTFFTGVRMPVYSLPLIEQQLISINQTLLGELVQSVRRQKETASTGPQQAVNTIAIGNSIQTKASYKPSFQSECLVDIQNANVKYRKFTGIENTQQTLTFSDLASVIAASTTIPELRAMIFYTAYLNGHDDNKVYTFNNDLGGTPLGGNPFPQISYGGREKYFTKEYACKTNQSGYVQPFAVFANYDNSVDFMRDYYVEQQSSGKGIIYSDPLYQWSSKENYAASMASVYIRWWPQNRTEEQVDKWIKSNQNSTAKLLEEAAKVVELCIQYKLISF
jgi:hypothetical protein